MASITQINAEDFGRIADVLGSCELVRGEIVPMSPGGLRHSRITVNATLLLEQFNRRARLGRVLSGEAGFVLARRPDTVRGADVAFISYVRLPRETGVRGFIETPPELIVEVLGDDMSWKRMEEKVDEYHAFGVDMIWVLDDRTRSLRCYPQGASPVVLHAMDRVSGERFLPGFECGVGEFFED